MKKAIKTELWKAFHNPMIWLALAAGAFIVGASARDCLAMINEFNGRVNRALELGLEISRSAEGYSLFVFAIPYDGVGFASRLFIYVWPLIAAAPYGWSYLQERRTGVYDQIVSRVGVRPYFLAKYIAVFVSGGAVVALTVLASLLVDAAILPVWTLHPTFMRPVFNGNFLSVLFYTHPWVHALIWCGVLFLFAGATACLCFFAWTGLRLRALAVIIPFALYFVMRTVIYRVIVSGVHILFYPELLLRLASLLSLVVVANTSGWDILYITGIVTALTLAVGYWRVVKHELD